MWVRRNLWRGYRVVVFSWRGFIRRCNVTYVSFGEGSLWAEVVGWMGGDAVGGFFNFGGLLTSMTMLTSIVVFRSYLSSSSGSCCECTLPGTLIAIGPITSGSFFVRLSSDAALLPIGVGGSPCNRGRMETLMGFSPIGRSDKRCSGTMRVG